MHTISNLRAKLLPKNLYSRLTLITVVTIITGYAIIYAWTYTDPAPVASGQALTANGWNAVVESLFFKRSGTSDISFINGGKVGIGTSSPSSKLQVGITGISSAININEVSDFGGNIIGLNGLANLGDRTGIFVGADGGIGAGIEMGRQGTGWGSYLAFYTNNITSGPEGADAIQEKVRVDQNGNVGIGTKTPTQRLDLGGGVIGDGNIGGSIKIGGGGIGSSGSCILSAYSDTTTCPAGWTKLAPGLCAKCQ